MATPNELLSQANIEQIAQEGSAIYERIKGRYANDRGKFLAIDIPSEKAYRADTGADAVALARAVHPDHVFFVVKIGYSSSEAMAHMDEYAYGLHPV